jgi:hypothetical protein
MHGFFMVGGRAGDRSAGTVVIHGKLEADPGRTRASCTLQHAMRYTQPGGVSHTRF